MDERNTTSPSAATTASSSLKVPQPILVAAASPPLSSISVSSSEPKNIASANHKILDICFWIYTSKSAKTKIEQLKQLLTTANFKSISESKIPTNKNCFSSQDEAFKRLEVEILAKSGNKGGVAQGFIIEIYLSLADFIELFNKNVKNADFKIGNITEYARDVNGKKIRKLADIQYPPVDEDKNIKICFICDKPAESVEHIIPQWLQRRFNLKDEELAMPNGKSLKYSFATIPACNHCNSHIWAPLEERIAQGDKTLPSDFDIWSWACKIHYGLNCNDKRLAWGESNKLKIGDVIDTSDPLQKAKIMMQCLARNFSTDPSPFGSVFIFRFKESQEFHFIHFQESSSICISLGKIGFVVFVTDGQKLKGDSKICEFYNKQSKSPLLADMLFFYANMHYLMHRCSNSGYNLVLIPGNNGKLIKLNFTKQPEKPFHESELQFICQTIGITYQNKETNTVPVARLVTLQSSIRKEAPEQSFNRDVASPKLTTLKSPSASASTALPPINSQKPAAVAAPSALPLSGSSHFLFPTLISGSTPPEHKNIPAPKGAAKSTLSPTELPGKSQAKNPAAAASAPAGGSALASSASFAGSGSSKKKKKKKKKKPSVSAATPASSQGVSVSAATLTSISLDAPSVTAPHSALFTTSESSANRSLLGSSTAPATPSPAKHPH